jgi:tRNA dimethylallyltransferase
MDVGTAKPDAATRSRISHHLIDVIDPTEVYSAARFAREALAAIAGIRARGRAPIVTGGTMLYFKALSDGLSSLPAADLALRAELDARAAREGWPALHADLARVDPATAARLQPTDAQRIQRALEVWHLAGVPLSALQGRRAHTAEALGATVRVALIPRDRTRLHQAIALRFDAMLAAGLVEELSALRRRYALTPDLPAMRCIGYRQAWAYLDGVIDARTLRARGIAATRQLAKRQFTWLRGLRETDVAALDPHVDDAFDALLEKVERAPGVMERRSSGESLA